MDSAPNPMENVPDALLPALADYEEDEDRPDGDMDMAETGQHGRDGGPDGRRGGGQQPGHGIPKGRIVL
jgi:hypothetical protein